MLLDFCISRNAGASKCRHGSTIGFQCRFRIDVIDARQELAAFPFVFQEVAVSFRPCPEHFFTRSGLSWRSLSGTARPLSMPANFSNALSRMFILNLSRATATQGGLSAIT